MQTLWQDLRYGARALLKKPVFTLIAIITLALGIGANTAIFSVVNAVLLLPLPYRSPEELVIVRALYKAKGTKDKSVSDADFRDWRAQNHVFADLAIFKSWGVSLAIGEDLQQIPGATVSGNFFELLGVNAVRGRTFLPAEDARGAERVVLLSYALWQSVFGADEKIVGQQVKLSDQLFTVVGVLPPGFKFPFSLEKAEIWTTTSIWPPEMMGHGARNFEAIARLKPGVSLPTAQTEMNGIAGRLEQENPNTNRDLGVLLVPAHRELTGDMRFPLWILFGAVAFVLLIACANVANLLLARALSRRKELAIRAALGAGRWRIARQLLTESLLLSLAGGALGLLLAAWGIPLLLALSPHNLPRLNEIGMNSAVFGFTFVVSILTGVLFGLAPALKSARPDLIETLKEGGKTSAGSAAGTRLRSSLVAIEIAIALTLLIGAGLLINSFIRLNRVELGYRPENVLLARLSLSGPGYPGGDERIAFLQRVCERIASLPGVGSFSFASTPPFSGWTSVGFEIKGRKWPANEMDEISSRLYTVTPDYFATMGIILKQGRMFAETDDQNGNGVALVNEAFVRRYFPNENPLGQIIKHHANRVKDFPTEFGIVGIVGNTRGRSLNREPEPEIYTPYRQTPWGYGQLAIRAEKNAQSLVNAVRSEIRSLDPKQTVADPNTLEDLISDSITPQRFNLVLLSIFAGIGLLLTLVGIYGVMSYFVSDNTHEIGIRMALGAQQRDVMKLVVGRGLMLALTGIALGIAGAYGLTRLMSSLLFGVKPTDPLTFGVVAAMFGLAAILACYIPARRAMKVDPMVSLRSE
jgi:putative ABC transport system permease protein